MGDGTEYTSNYGCIEIDLSEPCVWPRRSPSERADEAVTLMAHNLVQLRDAINAGAFLSPEKRASLAAYVPMMQRMGVIS